MIKIGDGGGTAGQRIGEKWNFDGDAGVEIIFKGVRRHGLLFSLLYRGIISLEQQRKYVSQFRCVS